MKRINTELLIERNERKQGLYIQKMVSRNFLTSLKRVIEIGGKVKVGMKTLTSACLESLALTLKEKKN